MDFFKGVGDFFGGLFGAKKKKKRIDPNWSGTTVSWDEPQKNNNSGLGNMSNVGFEPKPKKKSWADLSNDFNKQQQNKNFISTLGETDPIKAQKKQNEIINSGNQQKQKFTNFLDGVNIGDRNQKIANANKALDLASDQKNRPNFINKGLFGPNDSFFGVKKSAFHDDNQKLISKALDVASETQDDQLFSRLKAITGNRHSETIKANKRNKNFNKSLEYLNPISKKAAFGEEGLFGANNPHSSQNVARAITKPFNSALQNYEKWVDSGDKKEGFQWNDLGDYARFAAKLPSGMAGGILNSPEKITQALSGTRVNDKDKIEKLNPLQRLATAGDAVLDTAGLTFGGSGTLLKNLFKVSAKQAAKQGFKQSLARGAKDLVKEAGKEALEETTQTFLQDVANDSKLNTSMQDYAQSAALGGLGGGMMHGAGKAIGVGKAAVNNQIDSRINQAKSQNIVNQITSNSDSFIDTAQKQVEFNNFIDSLKQQAHTEINQRINPNQNPVQNAVAKVEAQNEIKYRLSEGQENYFKDSKVRDENGELMPVYHGTPNGKFNVFDFSRRDGAGDVNGVGAYFTDKKQRAYEYANNVDNHLKNKPSNPAVLETYLNIKNPFLVEHGDSLDKNIRSKIFNWDFDEYSKAVDRYGADPEFKKLGAKRLSSEGATQLLKDNGYDGAIEPHTREFVAFHPEQIKNIDNLSPTDNPDMRYKNTENNSTQSFSEQSLRKIIGNEYDIISKSPDGAPRTSQGYADLKNGIVAILDGKMSTANHEATHVAIDTLNKISPKHAENAINGIINQYGAETLVSEANKAGYGDVLGHELDINNEADVCYAAEERLANDFAKYAEAKAKGRENYYAKKTNMPAQIKAWFDYAIEYLKDMVGRLDSAHNFMYKLERGDYAQMIDQQVRAMRGDDNNVLSTRPEMAYKIDPETNIVHIDNNIIAGVPKSQILSTIKKYLQENLQGQSYDLNYGKDGEAKINARTKNKFTQLDDYLSKRGMLVGDLPDILKVSKKVSEAIDNKSHSFAKDGFEYRSAIVEVGGKYYNTNINIGIGNNGKILYTINKIKEVPQIQAEARSRGETSNNSNISQGADNVKMKITDTTDMETAGTKNPDLDVDEYVDEQVKAQKKAEKVGLIQKLKDKKALAKHHLVDDAVDYERYMTKEQKKSVLRDEIRNDIDKVRSSDMIAQQFIRDNGLAELGKLSTEELNQFQQYLIARRHAADLHKKGIKTGRDLDADLAIIDKYKKKFTNEEKIYRNFNKRLLQYMEDNGLISKELHTKLNKNKAYTPYQRLMDDVSGFTGHSQQLGNLSSEQVIKGIKGSERTILNPIEATMANTMRIINEGQRNIAARKIAENVFSENRLKEGQKPRAGYDTLNFMQDGKKVTYEVPQLVASEMKRLNRVLPDGVDKVVKVLSMPAKSLRAGATSLNPMFAVSNLLRDQFQTTVTGDLKTFKNGSKKALIATFIPGEKASALRAELRQQGIIGSEYRQTYGYKQGDLMKELQKEHQLPRKAWDRIKHPIDALNDLIGRTEYFTRAQQYFGTDGDVVAKSQAARNNTLNFSRGGSTVMVLNKIVPFLNAGVQGGRQITNQFSKRPVRTTLALTAWAGVALAAKGICSADDDKKELYDRVSDYEKRTNLILFGDNAKYNPETGRVDGLIKIPIPQFLYPITDAMNNLKGEPEDLLRVAGNIFEVFTGIDAENPVNQLTPTAIKPFIEAATNTNTFTGREIVSKYDKDLNPDEKGSKYTTGVARFMSSLTGVDAPVIDNFIQSWSGGLGKDLAKTLTDNPDNSRDSGGVGKILTEGTYRRFGSAGASSQYEIASAKGEEMKKALKSDPEFMNLSKDERNKIMRAIDNDSIAVGGALNKAERGEEAKKDLSDRQKQMFNGMNVKDYSQQVLDGSKSANKKRLYSEPDYEYNEFKKKHDKKLKKGEYSRKQKIEATKKLNKLKAGKDFAKETRDLYELGKSDFYDLVTKDDDGNRIVKEVLKYGDALVAAGVIERNKFRDRYGNVKLASSKGGRGSKGRRGGRSKKENHLSSYQIDTMSLIKGALNASSKGKTISGRKVAYNRPQIKANPVKRLSGGVKVGKKVA